MSQKIEKKQRKLLLKETKKHAQEQSDYINKRMEVYLQKLDNLLKPAPKFIPEFIWVSLQKLFLNI